MTLASHWEGLTEIICKNGYFCVVWHPHSFWLQYLCYKYKSYDNIVSYNIHVDQNQNPVALYQCFVLNTNFFKLQLKFAYKCYKRIRKAAAMYALLQHLPLKFCNMGWHFYDGKQASQQCCQKGQRLKKMKQHRTHNLKASEYWLEQEV